MYKLIRPLLFMIEPEKAHNLIINISKSSFFINTFKAFCNAKNWTYPVKIGNLEFNNPVGLAAGMDKNAEAMHFFAALGFGFIEIGTVTPRPQPGNEKPRLYRIPEKKALLNWMGFNNDGVPKIKERLKNKPENLIIGVNIGKNKTTPLDKAVDDYLFSFKELFDYADYFAINVSSPNTENLRKLQEQTHLDNILQSLQKENFKHKQPKQLFLKIAPDLSFEQIDKILDTALKNNITGIIATNTTTDYSLIPGKFNFNRGGISGLPLKEKSTKIIKYIREQSPALKIIGVGGIFTPQDVEEKLKAGADLVQIFTSLVYEGPCIVKKMLKHFEAFTN